MTSPRTSRPFDLYQREVEEMMETHTPFDAVEAVIDATELDAEHKAALWMLAWALKVPETKQWEATARAVLATQG